MNLGLTLNSLAGIFAIALAVMAGVTCPFVAFAGDAEIQALLDSRAMLLPGTDIALESLLTVKENAHLKLRDLNAFRIQLERGFSRARHLFLNTQLNVVEGPLSILFAKSELIGKLLDAGGPEAPLDSACPRARYTGGYSVALSRLAGKEVILLDPSGTPLDRLLVHRAVHEYGHRLAFIRNNRIPLWISEGLAELLAWRTTGLEPTLAIQTFLEEPVPRALENDSSCDFTAASYGQSYLFFRLLWERYGQDEIFEKLVAKSPDGAFAAIFSGRKSPLASDASFHDFFYQFIISLLLPPGETDYRYGWSGASFIKRALSPPGATLPAFSFALVSLPEKDGAIRVDIPRPDLIVFNRVESDIDPPGPAFRIMPDNSPGPSGRDDYRSAALLLINTGSEPQSYRIDR